MRVATTILAGILSLGIFAVPVSGQTTRETSQTVVAPIEHRIPILVRNGRIYVQAAVSGKKALLLVDTGAQFSTFAFALVPPHQVAPKDMVMRTANGTSSVARVETTLTLEALDENTPVVGLVGGIFGDFKFDAAQGLLGTDFLGKYASVTFDLQNQVLILVEKPQ